MARPEEHSAQVPAEKRRRIEEEFRKPDGEVNCLVLPMCDVQLGYARRIHDEEEERFRLPVTILGYLQERHRGLRQYPLGELTGQHRFGQRLKLVNVGPSGRIKAGDLGYWICSFCGGVRSPLATAERLDEFRRLHRQRCGKEPQAVGLGADVDVDGFLIRSPRLQRLAEAVSLAEAIRRGAARSSRWKRRTFRCCRSCAARWSSCSSTTRCPAARAS